MTKLKSPLLPLFLLLCSLALLIPGITQPMLTITGTMDKAQLKDTGIDILAESMVGDKDADPDSQLASKLRVKQMITGVTRMLGMSNISGEFEAYRKTRSISGTITDLYNSGDILVAFLVMLFSILIPTLKLLMAGVAALLRQNMTQKRLLHINSLLSKWSMADVFVVALIVTYMAANASGKGELLTFQSQFESGFFYFVGYCVFSIAAAQFVQFYLAAPEEQLEVVEEV